LDQVYAGLQALTPVTVTSDAIQMTAPAEEYAVPNIIIRAATAHTQLAHTTATADSVSMTAPKGNVSARVFVRCFTCSLPCENGNLVRGGCVQNTGQTRPTGSLACFLGVALVRPLGRLMIPLQPSEKFLGDASVRPLGNLYVVFIRRLLRSRPLSCVT
jgi:hypothetical protein